MVNRRRQSPRQPRRRPQNNQPKRKKKASSTPAPRGNAVAMIENVCALTDPFCFRARDARWTLGNSAVATVPYQTCTIATLITNADGNVNFFFDPQFSLADLTNPFSYRVSQPTAGTGQFNTGTNPDTGDSGLASVGGTFIGGRIVSAGATWWDIVPATGAGGYVIATDLGQSAAWYQTTSVTFGQCNLSQNTMTGDRRKPMSWVCKAANEAAYQFVPDQSVAATDELIRGSRSALHLQVTGPATTAAVQVEMIINYELQIKVGSAYAKLARVSPPSDAMSVAGRISNHAEAAMNALIPGGREAVGRIVARQAADAARSMGRAALVAAATYFGGPAGGMAAQGMMAITVD